MAATGPRLPNTAHNKKHLIAYPKCSCPKCDSLVCFSRRQDNKSCSCQKCHNSKTCLYFPYKVGPDNDLVNKVKALMEGEDIIAKETVKREITYEFDEVLKTRNVSKNDKKAMFSGDKESGVAEKQNNEKSSTQVHKVAINICRREYCSSAARLSDKTISRPHENIHDKVPGTSLNKISAYDIVKRIRDAYKACSCKVCECLVGKSLIQKNKECKCEPCECKDCMKISSENDPPDGCPCVRCMRSQCKGIVNRFDEPQICDCPPSNYMNGETYAKRCNCEPCQCLECNAMSMQVPRHPVVAQVGEQHQRQYCDCAPCECIECGGYGTLSSYIREAATNVKGYSHCQCNTCVDEACGTDGSQASKCKRRRISAKPIEKDVHDYEICTMITEDNDTRRAKSRSISNNSIAMYTRVPSICSNTHYQKECSCDVCECIFCNCKETAADSIKSSSQMFKDPYTVQFAANLASNRCKCFPCKCLICSNKIDNQNKTSTASKNCKCEVCYCLKCESEIKKRSTIFQPFNNEHINNIEHSAVDSCKCKPCECLKCTRYITGASNVYHYEKDNCEQQNKASVYPIKKAQLLILPSFTKEIHKDCNGNEHNKFNDSGREITSQRDFITCFKYPLNCRLINKKEHIHPPGEKTQMFPKTENNNINHYNSKNCKAYILLSNIYRNYLGNSFTRSKIFESASTQSPNGVYYENQIRAAIPIDDDPCADSCDSGYCSFDYSTLFLESSRAEEQKSQDCNKLEPSYDTDSYTNEIGEVLEKLNNTVCINVPHNNLDRYRNGLEFDNEYIFPRHNSDEDSSINHTVKEKYEDTTNKQIYGHHYWVKNIDVSLKEHIQNLENSKQNYPIDEDSKTDNTTTIQDEYSLYSQNIGDHSLSPCGKQVEDLFNNDTYYERVQNTLYRARAFSLQLMKILEKYEQANNEFKSITQKLNLSHKSNLNENCLEEPERQEDKICLSAQSNDQKTEHGAILQETPVLLSLSNDSRNDLKERTQVENSPIYTFSNDRALDVEKSECFEDLYNLRKGKSSKKYINDFAVLCDRKVRGVKKLNRSSTKILKLTVIISKKCQSKNASHRVIKTALSTQTAHQIKKEEATTDANLVSRICISTDDEKVLRKRSLEVLPISQKNFYLTTKPVSRNKGISIYPELPEVKQAVRSISMQTKALNNENEPRRNKALQNLQVEVKKLSEMPLLQVHDKFYKYREQQTMWLPKAKINENIGSTSDATNVAMECKSSKSCCDAHKVNFLGLRRVSDHTVLVKWTAPRVTSDVRGY